MYLLYNTTTYIILINVKGNNFQFIENVAVVWKHLDK
jgi:hypothetical protein